MADPVTAYAQAVVDGAVIAGRLVRLACARHLKDIQDQTEKGLVWKADEAQRAIDFFVEILCLPEETASDETAEVPIVADGTPFLLQPWQAFIVGSLFGWYTSAGFRRFRDGFLETAKGSGKTPLGAGIMLYMLVADGERGAQCYFAAVGKDQARIAHADAEKMVLASPHLRGMIYSTINNLAFPATGSFLRAISSEKRGLDGKRVHGALLDELHEHPTPVVDAKMRRGTKGRRNALVLRTTNSGYDRTSVCWHRHEYSAKILEGTVSDETWFAYICGLDACEACRADGKEFPDDQCPTCDDWHTEGPHWLKANPNLGVSISWQYLRDLVRQAKGMPSEVSGLLRFNFCVWTQQFANAIDMAAWQLCPVVPSAETLLRHPCYGGLDLGETDDLSAFALVWDLEDGRFAVTVRTWMPRAGFEKRPDRPYEEWRRAGVLTVTEGNVTDFDRLEESIAEDCQRFGVREVAYDKRFAEQMAQHLVGRGITMVDTPQGFQLTEAIKKVTGAIVAKTLCHRDNPLLSWAASNAVVREGPNKQRRWDKEKATDKIDPIVAVTLAFDRIVRRPVETESVYETRGPLVFG